MNQFIRATQPFKGKNALKYVQETIETGHLSGDGKFSLGVCETLKQAFGLGQILLTPSATSALQMIFLLLKLKPDDEVIMTSFNFPSAANAVLLNGATVVFCDIDIETGNICKEDFISKITDKTRAVIIMHYGGVCVDFKSISEIAKAHNLVIIEDAAQAIYSKHEGKFAGSLGDYACFSFHNTKNISCGEGGAFIYNAGDEEIALMAEIVREKGTNRAQFLNGKVDKYSWVEIGGNCLLSDVQAAVLLAQIEEEKLINAERLRVNNAYLKGLEPLFASGELIQAHVPNYTTPNHHVFWARVETTEKRNRLLNYLNAQGIGATSHFVPLHMSKKGEKMGYLEEDLPVSKHFAQTMFRLPIYPDLTELQIEFVVENVLKAAR